MAAPAINAESPRNKQIQIMLALMEQTGCALEHERNGRGRKIGICPFHSGGRRTLVVEADDERFHCKACGTGGGPSAFAGMVWGVASSEAYDLIHSLNGVEDVTKRPPSAAGWEREKSLEPRYRRQNTHVLTQASEYYNHQLNENSAGRGYLTALGISREHRRRCGIGYSSGRGLERWLVRQGCSEEEIHDSPLFRQTSEGRWRERYANVLTVSDRDGIGATKWMLMVPANADHAADWERSPRILGIWGQRPYLLGLSEVRRGARSIMVCDDVRAYMVARAAGGTAIYTCGRTNMSRIAEKTLSKRPSKIVIALTSKTGAEKLDTEIRAAGGPVERQRWSTEEVAGLATGSMKLAAVKDRLAA